MTKGLSDLMHKSWFVLRVFANSELSAERQLRQLGYDAMVPYHERLKRRASKSRHQRPWKFPLFPGYVFASWPVWQIGWNRIKPKDEPHTVEAIASIYGFLGPAWTDMPYILNPADVEHLHSMADGKYNPEQHDPKALRVGDHVLIAEGPFEGRTAKLDKMRGKKATLSLDGEKSIGPVEIELAKIGKCE